MEWSSLIPRRCTDPPPTPRVRSARFRHISHNERTPGPCPGSRLNTSSARYSASLPQHGQVSMALSFHGRCREPALNQNATRRASRRRPTARLRRAVRSTPCSRGGWVCCPGDRLPRAAEPSGGLLRVLVTDRGGAGPGRARRRAGGGQPPGRHPAPVAVVRLVGRRHHPRVPAALRARGAQAAGRPRARLRRAGHAAVVVGTGRPQRGRGGCPRLGAVEGRPAVAVALGLGAERVPESRAVGAAGRGLRLPARGPGGPPAARGRPPPARCSRAPAWPEGWP